jgi:hypothetical protein
MALEHGLLVLTPIIWTVALLHLWATRGELAIDFHRYYWPAGDRTLHGLSPYLYGPWYPSEVPVGFVYPAPAAVLFAGVSVIPRGIADPLFVALSMAAPLATLWVLNVRDWRPYGIVLLWLPVIFGWQCANLSMLVTLGLAVVWRRRDHAASSGVLLGVLVALKYFIFPVALFFLATRRWRAFAYATATTVVVSGLSWLIVGVDEIPRYRHILGKFTHLREDYGYSVVGFVERAGGGRAGAYAVAFALAAACGVACVVAGRRGREADAFILAIAATLLATPILWLHYLSLLILPVAIRYPRLHPVWALPILFWYGPTSDPATRQVAVAAAVAALVVLATLFRRAAGPAPATSG